MSYVPKLIQLNELGTLAIPVLSHVSHAMVWEKESCQELRGRGCQHLISAAFNGETTWVRHLDDATLWRPTGLGWD